MLFSTVIIFLDGPFKMAVHLLQESKVDELLFLALSDKFVIFLSESILWSGIVEKLIELLQEFRFIFKTAFHADIS